ncbi:hypothetical protein AG1IA_08091 [Rhizoctonia solani AG-1 IA]|uniref:Uncharacterized protein n=1 Tax=Thanatephorus cucumeris (strain AG1-IA) TaxID=983506 RepID=L8WNF6_THACA|nr:hypothetical protein AG1IA_08091 [Rhizoctonia solani AG-1 IA]
MNSPTNYSYTATQTSLALTRANPQVIVHGTHTYSSSDHSSLTLYPLVHYMRLHLRQKQVPYLLLTWHAFSSGGTRLLSAGQVSHTDLATRLFRAHTQAAPKWTPPRWASTEQLTNASITCSPFTLADMLFARRTAYSQIILFLSGHDSVNVQPSKPAISAVEYIISSALGTVDLPTTIFVVAAYTSREVRIRRQ